MEKWYYVVMGIFLVAMAGSFAVDSYMKGQCRETAIKAGKSAEDITRICR